MVMVVCKLYTTQKLHRRRQQGWTNQTGKRVLNCEKSGCKLNGVKNTYHHPSEPPLHFSPQPRVRPSTFEEVTMVMAVGCCGPLPFFFLFFKNFFRFFVPFSPTLCTRALHIHCGCRTVCTAPYEYTPTTDYAKNCKLRGRTCNNRRHKD